MSSNESNQLDLETINASSKKKQSVIRMRHEGKWNGGVLPFGISLDEEHRPYYNEKAYIVEQIFELYFSKVPISSIETMMMQKYPNDKLNYRRIKSILKNPIYGGYQIVDNIKYQLISHPLIDPGMIPKHVYTSKSAQRKTTNHYLNYKLKDKVYIDGILATCKSSDRKVNNQKITRLYQTIPGKYFLETKLIDQLTQAVKNSIVDKHLEKIKDAINNQQYKQAKKSITDIEKGLSSFKLDLRKLYRIDIDTNTNQAIAIYASENILFQI